MKPAPLRVLIVDDEAPARMRLRDILADLADDEPTQVMAMLANGREAVDFVKGHQVDVALLDVRMPVVDGVECARQIAQMPDGPRVIFVTAYDEYAVTAFDLAVADYLMKPVRVKRLAEALAKVRRRGGGGDIAESGKASPRSHLSISERGRISIVPVNEVLYFRAESKYVVAQTKDQQFLFEESLAHLAAEFSERFVRIHRNCLVAKDAIRSVGVQGPHHPSNQDIQREVSLWGREERLPVSRRLWPHLRGEISTS